MTRLIVVIAALIAVLCPGTAFAQTTVVVTRFDDPPEEDCDVNGCSLRQALSTFEPNVEVILPSAAQDYVLTSELGIGYDTTIRGPSAGLATIRLDASAPPSHVISVGTNLKTSRCITSA